MLEQMLIYGLLFAVVVMLLVRQVSTAVNLLAAQSVVLALLAVLSAVSTGTWALLLTAALTLGVKAIAIPSILHYTIVKVNIKREVEPFMSKQLSLAVAIGLVIVSYYVTAQLTFPGEQAVREFLPASLSLIFLGSFIMIGHKKAIMQGVGLITIENGLFLLTISLFMGMPLAIELGIFFEMLVMVIIIGILSQRIQSTFHSLSTDKLNRLKG